ncbi:MAG TPA: serine/threonine-protein kinase [Kofleriaceae bacterium]|nr:serine/threonine-protein kinase [Kofleriaceae bacterium]
MTRCFPASVADDFLHGRLSSEEFGRALKHASGCADCRHLLFAAARPGAEPPTGSMDDIQERLTTWRAARRAPLMPAFPWPKGHAVDRYVIIRSVGGTEDGVIYEAFDPEREDRVVVKQLDLHVDDPTTEAFVALARRQCLLAHPALLQMLSVGVHDGFVYLVYEFVKGTTLLDAGGDDPRQILALFAEAGRGLAAAHDAGIAHGFFAATSCVVSRDRRVKVLDFGIGEARIHRVAATRSAHDNDWTTSSDQVATEDSYIGFIPTRPRPPSGQFEAIILAAGPNSVGPRLYAAPELVLGAPPSPKSDQFAFCAALYHRLYGRPPYTGETIALWLRELLTGRKIQAPPLPGVPPAVQAALLRGLERDPELRFDRMQTLLAKLGRPARPGRNRTTVVIAAGAAAAVAVAGGIAIAALRGGSGAAEPVCDRSLTGWDDVWSTARQGELARASGPAADDAFPVLRTRIDAWVGSWRKATNDFCSLPGNRPQAADCAARARSAAADLLQLVQTGGPARLTLAAAAADALPTAEQCASSLPSPASAPLAAVKADLRRRLGMLDEADQLTAGPGDDPAQRGYQSLVRAHTAGDRGDLIAARRLFEDAAFEAQASRQPELAAAAALQRLALACSAAERTLWTGYVDAQLHLADKALAQPEYHAALAQSLVCEGKIAEAVKLRQQVVRALRGEDSPASAAAALELARSLLAQGDLIEAATAAHNAATIYAQIYGARHPLTQSARLTVAEAQLSSPISSDEAERTIDEVLADVGDRKEPELLRARALLLQGQLAAARGQRDDALRLVQKATGEYEAALGGTHPELAAALLTAADLLLASGRAPEAEAGYRQVAAIFDTLGQSDSVRLAHARAGIQLAHWGDRPPGDAADTLQWGLAPTGGAVDPAVTAWIAEQIGRRAAARGDQVAALAQYRAAAAAWQQSGDHRGQASALTQSALLAARLRDPDARALLEEALQASTAGGALDKPRLQGELAKLLWPAQRDRARALARAALADLPDSSSDASDLRQWLKRHDAER